VLQSRPLTTYVACAGIDRGGRVFPWTMRPFRFSGSSPPPPNKLLIIEASAIAGSPPTKREPPAAVLHPKGPRIGLGKDRDSVYGRKFGGKVKGEGPADVPLPQDSRAGHDEEPDSIEKCTNRTGRHYRDVLH
jgi:hypothetical protein